MNIQFQMPRTERQGMGNERRMVFRGRNPENMSLREFVKTDSLKMEDSLKAADRIRSEFIQKLSDGGNEGAGYCDIETRSRFFQLRDSIETNYEGDDAEKRMILLHSAMDYVRKEYTQMNATLELVRFDVSRRFQAGANHMDISRTFAHFEQIHASIMQKFEGEELDMHLSALFEELEVFNTNTSINLTFSIMETSGISHADNHLAGSEVWMAWRDTANDIQAHLQYMFSSAVDFFRLNGNFSGFEFTAAANVDGQISFSDLAMLSGTILVYAADLSEGGRGLLYKVANGDFIPHGASDIGTHQRTEDGRPPVARSPLDPMLSASTNEAHFAHTKAQFANILFETFMFMGLDLGFDEFKTLRMYLESRFEGAELDARIAALESAFLEAGDMFANAIANTLLAITPHYVEEREDMTLSKLQTERNARVRAEANRLIDHINGMFRAALEFFNETGTFDGFFETSAANPPNMPSMRDIEKFPRNIDPRRGIPSPESVINTPGLSDAGRGFLEGFFDIN